MRVNYFLSIAVFGITVRAERLSSPHLRVRDGIPVFKCDPAELGKLHCVDQGRFVICDNGDIPILSTAAGTYCDTATNQILPAVHRRDALATFKCDPAEIGKLHCVDQNHFVLCVDGNGPVQPLAAGTYCDKTSNRILALDASVQPVQEHSHLGPQVPPS